MSILDKFKLQDKVALVTGGGRNLGKIISIALAEAGADVVVASRTLSELRETENEIKKRGKNSLAIAIDITDFEQVKKMGEKIISEFGKIDILVNNAATRSYKPVLQLSEKEWRDVIETNLMGAFFCCKAIGPFMIRQGGGKIINISSRAGIKGRVNRSAYCASKGALIQLTRALALEWAPYNIIINAVAPGLINQPSPAKGREEERRKENIEKINQIPLRRAGEPEEIAPMVVYLASDACTYITGELILMDGGRAIT